MNTMRLLTCLLLVVLAISESTPCALFCYYVPNVRTKKEAQLTPDKLPSPMPCSHLVYGFASIDSQHEITPTNVNDLPTLTSVGNYRTINKLKVDNPQLRTMLAIRKHGRLHAMVNTYTRTTFARSVVGHLRNYNLDGVVLHMDTNEMDSFRFVRMINVMKLEFDRETEKSQMRRLQLVVAVPAKDVKQLRNKLSSISEQADYIYLIAHITPASADRNRAGYVDPLYPNINVDAEDTVNYNVKQLESGGTGTPKEKIIVGLSLWAHSYILANKAVRIHGSPTTDFGFPGKFTDTHGRLAYFEICEERQTDFGEYPVNEDSQAYANSFVGRLDQWFSFNQPGDILKKKVAWITAQSLGGVGLYSLDADDFFGTCRQGEFPLLKAVVSYLNCNPQSEQLMMTGQDMPIIPARIDHSDIPASFDRSDVVPDSLPDSRVAGPRKPAPCLRICYYRPEIDSSFDFTTLDGSWCSHIAFSPLRFQPDGTIQLGPSIALALDNFRAWNPMNEKPQLIFAVGSEQTSGQWKSVLQDEERRQNLAREIERVLSSNGATGVDISWTSDTLHSLSDLNVHALLVQEIRALLRPSTTVIVSVTPDSSYTDRYNFTSIIKNADFINLVGNNFHSAQRPTAGHHAPLFADPSLQDPKMSVESFAAFWIFHGARRAKLIIGVSAEAHTQQLTDNIDGNMPRLGMSTIGKGEPRPRTRRSGSASSDEVCEMLAETDAKTVFLKPIGGSIAAVGDQFISFDDRESATLKTNFASLGGFAGVALFALEYDNPRGFCPDGQQFPLLLSIVRAQVCPTCDKTESNSANCDASFKVICSYRIPDARSTSSLLPDTIPFDKCTHILVTEANLTAQAEVKLFDTTAESNFNALRNLKSEFRSTKLTLAVRCDMTSADLEEILDEPSGMIDAVMAAVQANDLDGIELNCDHLLTPMLRQKFSNFVADLRQAILREAPASPADTCPKSLGVRIPGWRLELSQLYEVAVLNEDVDYIALESYETSVAESPTAKPLSPLYSQTSTDHSIKNTVEAWVKQKLHGRKIVVVLPAFAITHQLSNAEFNRIGSPVASPGLGDDKRFERTQSELCQIMTTAAFMREVSFEQVAAFACSKNGSWLSYETRQTIQFKSNYAQKLHLGGVGLMALNDDDYSNECRLGAFPLLSAIANTQCN